MAKNKKRKQAAEYKPIIENSLPQNIVSVGSYVEENKKIYISQAAYKEIHKFTKNKTTNESGGMLVGTVIEEFGKSNIIINGFVEAKYCEATPTTLKFTHETWEYVHKEIEKKHKGKNILGWIHTHPDFGIFLSEYDKFIHQNFFNEEHQVAYVVDPIQNIEGFYFWINEKLEKCKGFYIYDKTGIEIDIGVEKEETEETKKPLFNFKNIVLAVLSVMVVFLIFSNISTNNKLEEIEKQQQTLADSANQSLAYMQQFIFSQATEIDNLNNQLTELHDILADAGIIVEPEPETTDPDDETTTDPNENNSDNDVVNDSENTGDPLYEGTEAPPTADTDVTTDEEAGATNEEGGNMSE